MTDSILPPTTIRNVAIIAHIDHGKTTLLDAVLRQGMAFESHETAPERAMDSDPQEKERGITILSKPTSVHFEGITYNFIDTPGHADFSGEVERVLGLVQTTLLIVDAQEGPMPQTRYVLSRALAKGMCPIVVINKIDRPAAQPSRVLDQTFDLFAELGATDAQLDFPYIFASALKGYAYLNDDTPQDFAPLFHLIRDKVAPPQGALDAPALLQCASIVHDDFRGRQAMGRVEQGVIQQGQTLTLLTQSGEKLSGKVTHIDGFHGLKRIPMDALGAGNIGIIAGFEKITIGDCLCDPAHETLLPPIAIEEPTVQIEISVNTSPLAGRDGKHLTLNKIRDRLEREARHNISLEIDTTTLKDAVIVAGRGELHLSVLVETMRREGFEMSLSRPKVIEKKGADGVEEPFETALIELPEEAQGMVIEELSLRRGEMTSMDITEGGLCRMTFTIPTRGLIGYRSRFLTQTKGLGTLASTFSHYAPKKGDVVARREGVLVSMSQGQANSYACFNLQERGTLFIAPGDDVYEGMVIGESSREGDMVVNPTKTKQLTNFRASGKDDALLLDPKRSFTLEQAIEYVQDDELVEVTPQTIRLRKKILKETERKRAR